MPIYLMYHEIELPGRPMCQGEPGYVRYVVQEAALFAQFSWLRQNGWRGLNVGQALQAGGTRDIVLTFDDGCETDLIIAAPLLHELGYSATFYVTAGFLGKRGFLTRSQLRQLSDAGFEIGCHSMSHPHLDDLDPGQLRHEIGDAKKALEEITGRSIDHFSCPGGRWTQKVVEKAKESGYRSLATSRASTNPPGADPFSLGRVVVMRGTDQPSFERLCHGQGLLGMRLQDSGRALTKRLLGNAVYDRIRTRLLR